MLFADQHPSTKVLSDLVASTLRRGGLVDRGAAVEGGEVSGGEGVDLVVGGQADEPAGAAKLEALQEAAREDRAAPRARAIHVGGTDRGTVRVHEQGVDALAPEGPLELCGKRAGACDQGPLSVGVRDPKSAGDRGR